MTTCAPLKVLAVHQHPVQYFWTSAPSVWGNSSCWHSPKWSYSPETPPASALCIRLWTLASSQTTIPKLSLLPLTKTWVDHTYVNGLGQHNELIKPFVVDWHCAQKPVYYPSKEILRGIPNLVLPLSWVFQTKTPFHCWWKNYTRQCCLFSDINCYFYINPEAMPYLQESL